MIWFRPLEHVEKAEVCSVCNSLCKSTIHRNFNLNETVLMSMLSICTKEPSINAFKVFWIGYTITHYSYILKQRFKFCGSLQILVEKYHMLIYNSILNKRFCNAQFLILMHDGPGCRHAHPIYHMATYFRGYKILRISWIYTEP